MVSGFIFVCLFMKSTFFLPIILLNQIPIFLKNVVLHISKMVEREQGLRTPVVLSKSFIK